MCRRGLNSTIVTVVMILAVICISQQCTVMMQAARFGVGADVKPPLEKKKEVGRMAERVWGNFLTGQMGASITKAAQPHILANSFGGEVEWCDLLGDQRLPFDLVVRWACRHGFHLCR